MKDGKLMACVYYIAVTAGGVEEPPMQLTAIADIPRGVTLVRGGMRSAVACFAVVVVLLVVGRVVVVVAACLAGVVLLVVGNILVDVDVVVLLLCLLGKRMLSSLHVPECLPCWSGPPANEEMKRDLT